MSEEAILSAEQTCALLANCSKRKLRSLVTRGLLKPRAFDGRTTYIKSEVETLIRSIAEQPPGRAAWRGRKAQAAEVKRG